MTCRRDDRIRSRPIPAVVLFALLLLCSIHPVAAFVQGEWSAYGGMALGCDGEVRDMVVSPEGIIYLGGSFGVCGNVAASNVVAFDPSSGEFSPLGTSTANGVNDGVYGLALHQGQLYVTGTFTRAGWTLQAARIARWNGVAWSALGSGLSNSGLSAAGLALAVHGGEIVVGGHFSHAGGAPANNIARWNGTGWHAFDMGGSNGVDGLVSKLASDGVRLYAGGYFSTAGSVPANQLAAWSGGVWHSLQDGLGWGGDPPQVSALEVHAGNLYVGGYFTTAGGVSTTGIARWDGSSWHAIGSPSHVWGINSISAGPDGLVVTGVFTQAGGVEANGLARWDGTQWHAMGAGLRRGDSGAGQSLLRLGDDLYVGGLFTFVDDGLAVNIAKLSNGQWQPVAVAPAHGLHAEFRNNAPHWPTAMASFGGSLYAAGRITLAGDQLVNNIARWDGAQWHPLSGPSGMGVDDDVHDLLEWDGTLWLAGRFARAGGLDSPLIARWTGSTWVPFQADLALDGNSSSTIRALATDGQNLYVAGRFASIGGVAANGVARWDGEAWHALGDGFGLEGTVMDLVMHEGRLLAAGRTSNDWDSPAVVWEWNGVGWDGAQFGWWAGGNSPASVDRLVSTVWGVIAIGHFDRVSGLRTNNVARRVGPGMWWGTGGNDPGWETPISAVVPFEEGIVITLADRIEAVTFVSVLYKRMDDECFSSCWWYLGNIQTSATPNQNGVSALALHRGRLFAGGGFSNLLQGNRRKAALGLAVFEPDRIFGSTNEVP